MGITALGHGGLFSLLALTASFTPPPMARKTPSVLADVLATTTIETPDFVIWTVFELAAPEGRRVVVAANTAKGTRLWLLDESVLSVTSGDAMAEGCFTLEVERTAGRDSIVVEYILANDDVLPELTVSSRSGQRTLRSTTDRGVADLAHVTAIVEASLGTDHARLIQVASDAAMNPIGARLCLRGDVFDLGIRVGDIHRVQSVGEGMLEIEAVEETLDAFGLPGPNRGVRYRITLVDDRQGAIVTRL